MSSNQHSEDVESAAKQPPEAQNDPEDGQQTPTQAKHQPAPTKSPPKISKGKRRQSKTEQSGSDTETEGKKMSSRSSNQHSSSSSKKHGSSSKSKAMKSDDWAEVTDPEERRRIQNRIAQRKFRDRAREQKEKNERDQRNREHAGSSYKSPQASDMGVEEDLSALSGLPWGGMNMRYVVERGHDSGSHGSRRASEQVYGGEPQYLSPYDPNYQGSSGGEELYYEGEQLYYDFDPSGGTAQ